MTASMLGVMALAALEMWAAFPAAYALQLAPMHALLTVGIGASVGTLLIASIGEAPRRYLTRRFLAHRKVYQRSSRLMDRYGVWVFAGLAPLLFGPPATTLVAYSLGAQPRKLLPLMLSSIWLWCGGIALVIAVLR